MKTAFITGACINTGVAIVKKFASEGWNVVFTGRDATKTAQAESEYKKLFPNVQIKGYALNSITANGAVNEKSVLALIDKLDNEEYIEEIKAITDKYIVDFKELL